MIIRNNTMGLRAYNANRKTTNSIKKNLEKLSSGYRINRSADDAAGLAVSERLRAKVTELDRCQDNAAEGIDLARTADAALQEVNDMLKRARSLCIQAENGTYSDQELSAISDEMNHLFGEIDRISAGSYHNSICLFRQGVGHTYHKEYDEHFDKIGDEAFQEWGEVDFIETKEFEEAMDATPATVTFTLDDSVDPGDPQTMAGKALTVSGKDNDGYTRSHTFYFVKNTTASYPSNTTRVIIGATMEKTLENLVTASKGTYGNFISGATIEDNKITLSASLRDWPQSGGVGVLPYDAPEGDAQWAHDATVKSPTGVGTLNPIDAANNAAVYEVPAVIEYTLGKTGNISQEDMDNLSQNTFCIDKCRWDYSVIDSNYLPNITIPLSGFSFTTWDQFGQDLATEIVKKAGYTDTTYSGGKLTIKYAGRTDQPTFLKVRIQPTVTGGTADKTVETWKSQGVDFTVTQNKTGTTESLEQCTVEIPSLDGKLPFSFSVDGYSYLYYNPNDAKITDHKNNGNKVTIPSATYNKTVGSSVTQAQIAADISSRVQSALGNTKDVTVRVEGNKLVVEAKKTNSGSQYFNKLKNLFTKPTYTFTAVKPGTPGDSSKLVIPTGIESKRQTVGVTFDLGSTDPKTLEGKGFYIGGSSGGKRIEFINSDNKGSLRDDYNLDIDLKSFTTLEDVRAAVALKFGSSYTVTLNGQKLTISKTVTNSDNYDNYSYSINKVTDGILGMDQLSKGGTVKFSGGVNTNHSQTTIDFSEINEDNLDTLLGKGFRINCASCSGEYINVFFCWTKKGDIPLTFEKKDPETGLMRTIHNIPVELSKITSGDKIVEDIVRQVKPSLNHYTDLAVGDPPTTLIAMEKRIGEVRDATTGKLQLGSVETGVETNFVYSVDKKWVMDPLEGDLDKLQTSEVNIYVGSDPEPQLIPIHLPYIDLYHLRLAPPERVDLTDASQSASDWLDRVDRADLAISDARGTIGADFNCLEHAIQDLSNAHIQLSDAYSVIRDADVAELMMKQVKDQILLQTQQSMLSQANQAPQGVLQLMQ